MPLWVRTDKTQREHNRSAFGCIATEASFSRHVEPDCRAVIQAPDWRGRIMRYELTDDEWAAIKPMLPNKPRGVPRVNDRRVLMASIVYRFAENRNDRLTELAPDLVRRQAAVIATAGDDVPSI